MFIPTTSLTQGSGTPLDGWVDDSAATWTRTADQTFTVVGDRTLIFGKGTRLKWTQTTVKYGVVASSSHAAGTTTVTIATTTDYVLTAAAITVNYYSYVSSPQGYPGWFAYSPTITGFTSAPTPDVSRFCVIGRTCTYDFGSPGAASNAISFTVTPPIAPITSHPNGWNPLRTFDNGAFDANLGIMSYSAGAFQLNRGGAGLGWTASGNKAAMFVVSYEI